jgi:hypothetical protein
MVESPTIYEPKRGENVSNTVVRALADINDTTPEELDLRLYDAVDPDALDSLFSRDEARPRVSFSVGDWRVVVDESRSVYVRTAEEPALETPRARLNPQTPPGTPSPR